MIRYVKILAIASLLFTLDCLISLTGVKFWNELRKESNEAIKKILASYSRHQEGDKK